jgi:hypothetical protein
MNINNRIKIILIIPVPHKILNIIYDDKNIESTNSNGHHMDSTHRNHDETNDENGNHNYMIALIIIITSNNPDWYDHNSNQDKYVSINPHGEHVAHHIHHEHHQQQIWNDRQQFLASSLYQSETYTTDPSTNSDHYHHETMIESHSTGLKNSHCVEHDDPSSHYDNDWQQRQTHQQQHSEQQQQNQNRHSNSDHVQLASPTTPTSRSNPSK